MLLQNNTKYITSVVGVQYLYIHLGEVPKGCINLPSTNFVPCCLFIFSLNFLCTGPIPAGAIVGGLLAIILIGTVAVVAIIVILW